MQETPPPTHTHFSNYYLKINDNIVCHNHFFHPSIFSVYSLVQVCGELIPACTGWEAIQDKSYCSVLFFAFTWSCISSNLTNASPLITFLDPFLDSNFYPEKISGSSAAKFFTLFTRLLLTLSICPLVLDSVFIRSFCHGIKPKPWAERR